MDVINFNGNVADAAVGLTMPDFSYAHVGYEHPNFFIRGFWNGYDLRGPVMANPLLSPFLRFTDLSLSFNQTLRGNTYNVKAQQGIELGATARLTAGINYRHNTLSHNSSVPTLSD